MNGLYALKPWYAARLGGVRTLLVAREVPPWAITAAGVAFAAAAGAVLATTRPGPLAALAVALLLAARLACANLDGGVARESGRATRFGAVVNELGDRLAELAVLAGCLVLAPPALVATTALAATLPSWIALAGAAAGARRAQGGPVGKTERCVLLAAFALTGWAPWLIVLAAGSAITALVRLARIGRELA
ncbi:CDP-alcohol phosphatidyltransferase family protein [Nonomuraea endophytica]|uniref:CDP-diacylglycerol--glycerol-3-phosphate 3-phosphatidyltransferase n=1 Tax=Nonomuraea endophytica TaxID=714136 RepID=A0A7W8A0K8_9ACTN|nr:CDP-alcohol phosphatidyltransferase family protein [Nonomuraea endophytica]MBB5076640.1 CDP-diacylglycerol--glycerol-3-phosphate 3-phosphatidyltransferase [Nonomuraea endophytica]